MIFNLKKTFSSLQYGQTKDVVVKISGAGVVAPGAVLNCTLKYEQARTATVVERTASCGVQETADIDLKVQQLRLDFVSTAAFVMELVHGNKTKEASAALADIEERVRHCDDPRAKALLQDISGQVKEAIQKTPENYFQKWGRHYLPSLARAHLLQQCNNFKDPGIQVTFSFFFFYFFYPITYNSFRCTEDSCSSKREMKLMISSCSFPLPNHL